MSLLLAAGVSHPAIADVCTVPGSHATIRQAILAPACTEIQLANQVYEEALRIERSLTVAGPPGGSATIEGFVEASGSAVVVNLADLIVTNGCPDNAFLSTSGASLQGTHLQIIHEATLPCLPPIFADGFESGNTSAWSSTIP